MSQRERAVMSYSHRLLSLLGVFIAALGLFSSAARAQPQPVLLTVNISNPAQIKFTSTGAFPQINNNGSTPFSGILLVDLFTADFDMSSTVAPLTGNLATTGAVPFEVGFANGLAPRRNFNLFARPNTPGANDPSVYSTATPAFVGSSVADLSGFPPASLQAPGFIGNVLAGDFAPASPVIGTYLVILPEPTCAAALGITLIVRRRRD